MQRNSRNIPLSHKEIAWVNSRGGRDMEYVFKDKSGKYIWLKDGKVYIPQGLCTKTTKQKPPTSKIK